MFLQKINTICLLIIALISSILVILSFFNAIPQLNINYYLLSLLLLSFIGIHLAILHLSQDDFRDEIKNLFNKVADKTVVENFQVYRDSNEIETALAKKIIEARNSICDLSWKIKISESFSSKNRQVAHSYMDNCISKASERISYREIFVFNDERRIDKLNRRISENKDGYSCGYFKEGSVVPRLQFVIIDNEEVFIFASSSNSPLCSFRDKNLSKIFQSYYESLWEVAIPIKIGPQINQNELENINKI